MVSTGKVTGIIGAGRGTGVTHFSIRAANYFCSWKQRKTAVIQWNSHKDTERMRNFLEASGKEGGRFKKEPFRVLEVDFYCQGGPEVLAACMEKKYQEILIDFGEVRDEVFPEWLRCSEKILIADLSEWKLESFLGLFTEKEKTGKDWICLTAFETRNRKTVSPFCETDPSFSRCIFSGHSDHGMVCGYIGIKENWPYPGRYMSQGLRNRMRSGGGKLQYEKQEKK